MEQKHIEEMFIERTEKIRVALKKIDKNIAKVLFVVNSKKELIGTMTDGDIRRWLIKTGDLEATVENIMNTNPKFVYKKNKNHAHQLMIKHEINCIPVLNENKEVINVIFQKNNSIDYLQKTSLKGIPVIIMAGGEGTRLYPYTKILPKPLIPVGDIPIIERIMSRFCDYAIDTFYLTVNYKKNMIKSYFTEEHKPYSIFYLEEEKPLGTAGSLYLINKKFNSPIFVTNCDILINADYSEIYAYHKQSKNDMTIVSALKNIIIPYGVLNIKEDGVVGTIEEKPKTSYFVNTGMYILNPDIIEEIPKNTFFHMTDLATSILSNGKKVGIYPISEDSFLDMGEFEEMNRMEKTLDI